MGPKDLPLPGPETGRRVLQAFLREKTPLSALEIMHHDMGEIFRLPVPGFNPVVLVGPEANRFVLVTQKESLRWRLETDPVTKLLRHGVLVEDGESHDILRRRLLPALHKRMLGNYIPKMVQKTDEVTDRWASGGKYDMLVEMRRIALLILMDTLFGIDFSSQIDRMWNSILRILDFISPGMWILWPDFPRPRYRRSITELNRFLYQVIADRRNSACDQNDLLSLLVSIPEMTDDLIRDQLLTLLIAGHDTSTALLSWVLHLLGQNSRILERVRSEICDVLRSTPPSFENISGLIYLEQVISETLRMYPPIHIGNRIAAADLEFKGYHISAGTRVMYSIYLSHRQEKYWPDPDRFDPERFSPTNISARQPYTYVAFGGGARNCIGLAFAKVEVKIILARLLQTWKFEPLGIKVHPHMGATLEPRPGVWMQVYPIEKGILK